MAVVPASVRVAVESPVYVKSFTVYSVVASPPTSIAVTS